MKILLMMMIGIDASYEVLPVVYKWIFLKKNNINMRVFFLTFSNFLITVFV